MSKRPLGYVRPKSTKKMDKSVKDYTFDITFCDEVCDNTFCLRNYKRIIEDEKEKNYPHSMSSLRGTEYCPSYLD